MMTFVNMQAPGLVVLATHRVLDGLPDFDPQGIVGRADEFFSSEALASSGELRRRLDSVDPGSVAFGAVFRSAEGAYLFRAKPEAVDRVLKSLSSKERGLDVVVLHKVFIEKVLRISEEDVKELKYIRYARGFEAAADEVASGRAQAALAAAAPARSTSGGDRFFRRGDAAEVHRFLSEAALRPNDLPD